jgi:hypothetical protein
MRGRRVSGLDNITVGEMNPVQGTGIRGYVRNPHNRSTFRRCLFRGFLLRLVLVEISSDRADTLLNFLSDEHT